MVEQVERLQPEGQIARAVDVEVLAQTEVDIPVSRSGEDADAGIAELASGGPLETVGVDPCVIWTAGIRVALTGAIRPLERARRLERLAGAVVNGDRKTRVRLENRVELPAAKDQVLGGAPVSSVLPIFAERQVVVRGKAEDVSHVVRRRSVVAQRVAGIHVVVALARCLT